MLHLGDIKREENTTSSGIKSNSVEKIWELERTKHSDIKEKNEKKKIIHITKI